MDGDFPLSLPKGAVAALLPWEDDLCQGWVVNANTAGASSTATWTFGKVTYVEGSLQLATYFFSACPSIIFA